MKRQSLYVLGIVLLVAFAGFAFTSFKQTLTPYVGFAAAKKLDRSFQVAGSLVKESSSYADGALSFTIQEPQTAQTLRVRYRGVKPANFEEALSVVAIGRYSPNDQLVEADQLLVKCPSKYQGVDDVKADSNGMKRYGG